MKKILTHRSGLPMRILPQVALLMVLFPSLAKSQQGSKGNTVIFSGTTMTFFGSHNFLTGGSGVQPGIIGTVRTAPYGTLNFASTASSYTGADNANYVEGYIRKSGTASFIFPVGNNGHYGPFAASADGTTGAYFHADPNAAVIPDPAGGNYPPLPAGAPFSTSSKGAGVTSVSPVEYWDIDGSGATNLTLTWNAGSGVGTLTGNTLSELTIVGWDGSKWVNIPSTVDATSVLGGSSSLTAGSITTSATITPNSYVAYTLGYTGVALPVTLLSFTAIRASDGVKLNWETTDEVNFSHFEIQHSTPMQGDWTVIGTVPISVAGTLNNAYSFTHPDPAEGVNLYRLKMIDLDGKYTYSQVCAISMDGSSGIFIYPNPASDVINIQTNHPGAVRVAKLSDWNGKTLQTVPLLSNDNRIDVKAMVSGIYILTIFYQDGSKDSYKVFIKH
ncbi:T9SS type A sorting domain-containing protein [Flavitalea sp. BT771]|uniref:T9SS type A sorting domain-containing protein n=1 Tax=Flavitalea sp. BT771 TaxID=3063329 RepID=UPI0026E2B52F|nr:T9SS type A sorting domain-containing protein [Flavitalea sp. BT771]MDO6432681.1 T9SS type A sorting domain-containing protein [Flavitalea sp. BT771]MDV6222043.1 T9SS type A sorting domain-containing protein [Flavitalea sp. BT771]